jgi:hypothetical protein
MGKLLFELTKSQTRKKLKGYFEDPQVPELVMKMIDKLDVNVWLDTGYLVDKSYNMAVFEYYYHEEGCLDVNRHYFQAFYTLDDALGFLEDDIRRLYSLMFPAVEGDDSLSSRQRLEKLLGGQPLSMRALASWLKTNRVILGFRVFNQDNSMVYYY